MFLNIMSDQFSMKQLYCLVVARGYLHKVLIETKTTHH